MSAPIRVGLVDDHPIVRAGIRALLEAAPELSLVGDASTGAEALQLFADIWARPVRRRSVTAGATSLGVAITGLVGLGALDFSAAPTLSTVEREVAPSSRVDEYAEHKERFVGAYMAAAPWFEGTPA